MVIERALYYVILAAKLLCEHPALLDKAYAMFCLQTLSKYLFPVHACNSSFKFQASRFVDKLLASENATFPIPMPHIVVIELVVSELWLFEAAITE